MDLFEVINGRRSVRRYSDRKLSKEDLEKIIEAGIYAPSACDIQGWRFLVVDNPKLIKELVDRGAASFIKGAPIGILVIYDNRTENIEYLDHIQSAAASIENMLLAASSLGIGSCWVCHLPRKQELRELFEIPGHYDPIAYISLGYFNEKTKIRPRKKKVSELISYNKFDFNVNEMPNSGLNSFFLKRLLRRVYYLLPFKKYIHNIINKKFEKKFE